MIFRLLLVRFAWVGWAGVSVFSDGPKDNIPENVRRIPPLGIEVPEETAAALKRGLAEVASETGFFGENWEVKK